MQQPLRLIRLWYALGVVLLLAVALVSLLPVPNTGVSDKLSHLITYGLLAGWFCLLARSPAQLAGSVVGLIAYGMVIEWLQGHTGYRYAEWGDVIANAAGCLLGALVYFTPLRAWFGRFDAWLGALR